jgi:hypothetical protein
MTRKKYLILILILVTSALFVWGAKRQATLVNIDMHSTDQSAYMRDAKNLSQTNFRFVTGRNRMPVYPSIMALFYHDGMPDEEYFALGKWVGIVIALLVLGIVFFIFNRYAKPLDALTATLVVSFTVIVYKAPFFQPELLFYGESFILFVLILELLKRPRIAIAAAAGLIGGIAHLTKASILPAIVLCLVCLMLRAIIQIIDHHKQQRACDKPASQIKPILLTHIYSISVFLVAFLLLILPYIHTSKERYGSYFYNVNSTFYIWYDSWHEASEGTRIHGDTIGWPDMPEDEIPGFHRYIQEHTPGQIIGRFARGLMILHSAASNSYGYAFFIIMYGAFAALLIFQNRGLLLSRLFNRANAVRLFFIFAYFTGYLLLYAWYTPIASGNRFILALFLPAMLLLIRILSLAQNHHASVQVFGSTIEARTFSSVILLMLLAYIISVYPLRVSTMYGGN